MLLVNEDINDELFRRAADNYPLKTDKPDWDAVLNKLNTAGAVTEPDPAPKKRNKYYRLLLLLLLFIPFAIFENRNSSKPAVAKEETADPKSTVIVKEPAAQNITGNEQAPVTNNNQAANQQSISAQNEKTGSTTTANDLADLDNNKTTNPVIANVTSENPATAGSNKKSSKQRSSVKIKNGLASADGDNKTNASASIANRNTKKKKTIRSATSVAVTNPGVENDGSIKKEPVTNDNAVVQPEKEAVAATVDPTKKEIENNKAVTPDIKTKQPEKEIAKTTEKTAPKENKNNKAHTKHFYAGLVLAPDFSAIKMQSLKKVGLNYGFLLGYKLSKKFSIETGLLQDRKYYSTDGKYFSTKNIYLPPTETIDHVDGVCKMLELPINITYTFSERKRSAWFGSLGFSSYFMQHENYTYELNYGGYRYPKSYDYANKSTSLFAMVNVSAGYNYKLGKIGDLRIEPYIKLPVNKIGTGNLPIQSAGIFVGFTKLIF